MSHPPVTLPPCPPELQEPITLPQVAALLTLKFTGMTRAKFDELLALPRAALLLDVRRLLRQSIDRYPAQAADWKEEYYNDSFFHAVALLGALGAKETLPEILDHFRIGGDYFDRMCGDVGEEMTRSTIVSFAKGDPKQLLDFVREPGIYWFQQSVVLNHLGHIYWASQDGKDAIIELVLAFYRDILSLPDDDQVKSDDLLTALSNFAIEIRSPVFEDLIRETDEQGYLIRMISGGPDEIMGYIHSPPETMEPRPVDLYDYYALRQPLLAQFEKAYLKAEIRKARLEKERLTREIADTKANIRMEMRQAKERFEARPTGDKKIGRNAPCPCGSGKKYKKCCLNRFQ